MSRSTGFRLAVLGLVVLWLAAAWMWGFNVGRATADTPTIAAPLPGDAFRSLSAPKGGTDPVTWDDSVAAFPSFPPAPTGTLEATPSEAGAAGGSIPPSSAVGAGAHRAGKSVAGTATWYCGGGSPCTRGTRPGDMVAAAGSEIRVGHWRGRVVSVCIRHSDICVRVRLVDVCACAGARVIDLSAAAFARLSPLSRGIVAVRVSW